MEHAVQRFVETPVPSTPSLRHDGTAVAVTVTAGDVGGDRWVRHIAVLDLDGTPLASTDGPSDASPRWSPVDDRLAFVRPDDAGVAQVWLIDRLGEAAHRVTSLAGAVRAVRWAPDATKLAVVGAGAPTAGPIVTGALGYKVDGRGFDPPSDVVGVVDVDTGAWTEVETPATATAIGDAVFTTDGRALLVTCGLDDRSWRWDVVRIDLDTGVTRVLSEHHGAWDRAASPVGLPDGSVVYVGGEAGPGHATLQLLAADGSHRTLAPGLDRNVTIGSPAYPGAAPVVVGTELLFTANDLGSSRLYRGALADGPATDAVTPISPAGAVITGVDARAGVTVVTASTATDPGIVAAADGDGWRTIASYGERIEVPWTAEPFDAVARDGAVVPGVLLRSRHADSGAAPLVLDIHGGPHNAANPALAPGNLHRWHLAAAGWHVLLANPRGSDGFGEHWYRGLEPGGGWAGEDADDLLALVDAAVDRGIADVDRLAVTGYSYGGLMTALLTSRTDRFRSAVMGGAPVDLAAFVASSDLGPVLFRREVGGSADSPSEFDLRSPITSIDRVRTPTLVLHGLADQRVPASQAEQWFQSLRELGVACELVLYPSAPHGFVTAGPPQTVLDVGERTARWILGHR